MGNRLKKMKTYALDPDMLDRLEAFRSAQVVPPPATSVLEKALEKFLAEHGFGKGAASPRKRKS